MPYSPLKALVNDITSDLINRIHQGQEENVVQEQGGAAKGQPRRFPCIIFYNLSSR